MRKLVSSLSILTIIALLVLAAVPALAAPATQAEADIVDTAVAAGNFNTLAALLTEAGLVETLKGEGPFTVFAPTDEAFAAVPAETLAALQANPDELVKVLTYHVVPGKVMAADVVNLTSADTVAGIPVSIAVADGNVMVGNATVTATDIEASNGVIHVVDAVILPPAEDAMMDEPMAAMDIVDTAVAAGSFNSLAALLTEAGLVETLKGEGPFTVFAPTDEAFAAVPAETLAALQANPDELVKVLTYHVVPGKVMAADVVNLTSADTVAGIPVSIAVADGNVMVGNATVTATDIEASNGVIHVVDAVILPPAEDAMMDESAMGESVASCSDYTVQADDWLSKIAEKELGDVLAYPQLVDATNAAAAQSSKYAMISNADIIEVGQVVCIPAEGAMMDSGEMMAEPMAEMDIVDTAVAAGNFTTLAALLTEAGLVDTLKGEGPFTVFAPTDEAFAAVPAETLAALQANPDELVKVLTYHVVPGKVMAADVVNLTSADTVAGIPVSIAVADGSVMVGNATVTATDIEASNGVIHVVDAVILPPAE